MPTDELDRPVVGSGVLPLPQGDRRECAQPLRAGDPPLALEGRQRAAAPVPKLLDGEPEARVIAMRLSLPLPCYSS